MMDKDLRATNDSVDYAKGETPMTDYQFKSYIEERDRREKAERNFEALYQLIKAHIQAGKTPEEILTAVEALRKNG